MKTSTGEAVVTIPNVETMPVAGPIAKRGMIIRNSRERYCRPRDEVEREIRAELVPEEHGAADDNGDDRRDDDAHADAHGAWRPGAGTDNAVSAPPPAIPPRSARTPVSGTRRRGLIAPLLRRNRMTHSTFDGVRIFFVPFVPLPRAPWRGV